MSDVYYREFDTHCAYCGTRYVFQEKTERVFVAGDWFGHHPDHHDTYISDNLKTTKCPNCGKTNNRRITLEEFEKLKIEGVTTEEKYKIINKTKIAKNTSKIEALKERITYTLSCISDYETQINNSLKTAKESKTSIEENNIIISQLQSITIQWYKDKEIQRLLDLNENLKRRIKNAYAYKEEYLKKIKKEQSEIENLKMLIEGLEKENNFYISQLEVRDYNK